MTQDMLDSIEATVFWISLIWAIAYVLASANKKR